VHCEQKQHKYRNKGVRPGSPYLSKTLYLSLARLHVQGGCGACTVMLSHWEGGREDGRVVHRSANACLCPLYAVEGMHVVTVEGEGQ
jgi:aerobic-type carbon monoxide dehydrogenase small subunit (CoxS/CutS family)